MFNVWFGWNFELATFNQITGTKKFPKILHIGSPTCTTRQHFPPSKNKISGIPTQLLSQSLAGHAAGGPRPKRGRGLRAPMTSVERGYWFRDVTPAQPTRAPLAAASPPGSCWWCTWGLAAMTDRSMRSFHFLFWAFCEDRRGAHLFGNIYPTLVQQWIHQNNYYFHSTQL